MVCIFLSVLCFVAMYITIFVNEKFAYKDGYGRYKVHIINLTKLLLLLSSLVPIVNLISVVVYIGKSLGCYNYQINPEDLDDENEVIKWLFK